MPPSGEYSTRIAPADAMVINFSVKIELWRCEIAFRSYRSKGTKQTLYSAHRSDKLRRKVEQHD
jgi:hypothetical protein